MTDGTFNSASPDVFDTHRRKNAGDADVSRTSGKRLAASLAKLGLIVGGILGGFHLLFDTPLPAPDKILANGLDPPKITQTLKPGPRIIFRLDDVEQGVREKHVLAILEVFERLDAPLELGVVPLAGGEPSHAIPRLRPYVAAGAADISVHGVTHVPNEFQSSESGLGRAALAEGLLTARARLQEYYGVYPLAFLVPYDVFDETGFNAVRDAGFEILSSQWQTDTYRGTARVDFHGNEDEHGLYRLPSVDDAVTWDAVNRRWGDFQPMSNLLYSVRASLERIGVAIVSLHPAAFDDGRGGVDAAKIAKLKRLVEAVRDLGMPTTFRNWYCTQTESKKPADPRICPPAGGN
jgi:hypothetical protein